MLMTLSFMHLHLLLFKTCSVPVLILLILIISCLVALMSGSAVVFMKAITWFTPPQVITSYMDMSIGNITVLERCSVLSSQRCDACS